MNLNAGPVLDGRLDVTLGFSDGGTQGIRWPASNISWTPEKVTMHVGGKSVSSITLSTNATNGFYGIMVQHRSRSSRAKSYGTVVKGTQGYNTTSPKAELYVYQM